MQESVQQSSSHRLHSSNCVCSILFAHVWELMNGQQGLQLLGVLNKLEASGLLGNGRGNHG